MSENVETEYRNTRNVVVIIMMIAWLVYWWMALSERHDAVVAAYQQCSGIFDSVRCELGRGGAQSERVMGMVLAVITAPLAYLAANPLSRMIVNADEKTRARQREQHEQRAMEAQRKESEQRMARVTQDAQQARQQVDRGDFIHTLGAVSDFLDLLEQETKPARISTIRLGVSQSLRELIAKHSSADLPKLIAADDAVKLSLNATLRRLEAAGFAQASEVQVLRMALPAG